MKIKILDTELFNKYNTTDNYTLDEDNILLDNDIPTDCYPAFIHNNNIEYEYGDYCYDCNKWTRDMDLTYIEDEEKYVCDDCLSDSSNYFYCNDCQLWYSTNSNYYHTHNDDIICEACYEDSYFTCQDCGEVFHTDYMNEYDGHYNCESCYNDNHSSNLMSYHSYHDWTPLSLPDEPTPPFYIGHELEIDEGYSQREAIELINQKINCICMEDGSLSEDGIEIISQPLSYNYMLAQEQYYRETFSKLANSYNYTSHQNDTCGLHFHVTRPNSEEVIDRIILFMETYKEEIIKLSRRTTGEIESWCNFLSDRKTTSEKEIKSLDYIKKNKEQSWRYMALNLTNSRTIEFRIFKGTLKYETFMADFEFVYNLTLLASDLSIPIEELTWTKVTSFGKFLPDYIREHELQTDKPIHDYTQEIIIEINQKKEELTKETMITLKDLMDRMKKNLRKTQELNYNTLYTINDRLYYGNRFMNSIREIMGKLEYSEITLDNLNDISYKLETIKSNMNSYLRLEVK